MNPTDRKKAVAITYKSEVQQAPIVTAKGSGFIAEAILNRALAHEVPIREDRSLVELLSKLELNQQIPEELYQVMAEVLALVYRMDKQVGSKG